MHYHFGNADTATTLAPVSGFSMAQMAFQLATEQGFTKKVGASEYWFENPVTGEKQNFYIEAGKRLNDPKYRRTGDIAVTVKEADKAVAKVYATQEDVAALGLTSVMQLARAQATGVSPASTSSGPSPSFPVPTGSSGGGSSMASEITAEESPAKPAMPAWLLPVGAGLLAYVLFKKGVL